MKFELSQKEIEARDKFYKYCKRRCQGKDVRLSYHFFPTGIGDTLIIKSETLGIEKNITDMDSW
jgi:hypothetical protein